MLDVDSIKPGHSMASDGVASMITSASSRVGKSMGPSVLILAGHLHHQHLSVISRTGVHFALACVIVGTDSLDQ